LKKAGDVKNRRGTSIAFHPDPEIFGAEAALRPARLYRMTRSKAYLFRGVEIRWSCDPALLGSPAATSVPETDRLHFPGGLVDFLAYSLAERPTLTPEPFAGEARFPDDAGKVEWALAWPADGEGFVSSYCNIIPTPLGGSHESGLRAAILRGFKAYGELTGNRAAQRLTAEDAIGNACVMLSVFLRDPQFQGQTKEKLATPAAARLVEAAVKDHFDHWLSADPARADGLLAYAVERAEDRLRRKQSRELARKSATRKARLPGKLTDCTQDSAEGTELFLVEGDSAGGSAKQARDRRTQAILPLRGKILNVASATVDKMQANQEIRDMIQALGCGTGAQYREADLRYDRVVIMTDADVDGAHIASLLMTFFFKQMPGLVAGGHLYLAMPPLYRLS
ncbi:MAG: DNA topoisomerase IV subunit B, partial [Alphaproteobacteria bacterium]|nr:DNA topoisomerase IV subunit B [Alphaproteobacteria bacterium]